MGYENVADLRLLDSDDFWVKVVATDGFVPEADGGDSIVFHLIIMSFLP